MALDAATLALTAAELKAELLQARIDKIFQPTRDEVLLAMRSRTDTFRLLLSARLGSARVCLTGESYENPLSPPSFCMLLRKHLTGGRLADVRVLEGDRVVYFDFLCTNEMGDAVTNIVAAELMGRYCNLVLLRASGEGEEAPPKIIDALKRVDFEDSAVRQLLPGLAYTMPPKPAGKLDLFRTPFAELAAGLRRQGGPLPTALCRLLGNVGPVVAREICFRALGGEPRAEANALSPPQFAALERAVAAVRADWEAGGTPQLVRGPDGMPVEFGFTPFTQYLPHCTLQQYPTFSRMLEGYYAEKDRLERLRQKAKGLRKTVQNLCERAQRKQAARQEELAASENSEHLRVSGELLTASLHLFAKGCAAVRVQNWYTGQEETIRLDPRLAPSQNAQRYFKEYKKKQTAGKVLAGLLAQGRQEVEYLASVLYEVEAAEGEAALEEIRAELKEQGYLRHYRPKEKRRKPADFLRYRSADGFLILVGRNNLQNERLTLKAARGKDLWFHTRNAPGSHVVVMSEGAAVPLKTQNQAAMLAVWHSSQKNGAKVPVDYTPVKNIRKTGGLPPGMVLYEQYETAYITVEQRQLPALCPV